MDPRLQHFIELFNTHRYFEAHEVLEELWIETEGLSKDFYKGLIQCAVAFVHRQRNNPRGARRVYERSQRYLRRYLPSYETIDTAALVADFDRCFEQDIAIHEPPRISLIEPT